MENCFGVAVGPEGMSSARKVAAEFVEVVDLAVLENGDISSLIPDRLLATFEVDDRQASHAHRQRPFGEDALIVGAAVNNHVAHGLCDRGRKNFLGIER